MELPPISKDNLTKTPDIYSIRRKAHDLTSRDSISNKGSIESPDFNSKLNKLRIRKGNMSVEKRTVSPTFKTQLEDD